MDEHSEDIPLHILHQKQNCSEFIMCKEQNVQKFVFFPLNRLKNYMGPSSQNLKVWDIVALHHMVKNSGLPNILGCVFQSIF